MIGKKLSLCNLLEPAPKYRACGHGNRQAVSRLTAITFIVGSR
jgi:hypothetical protein